MDELSEGDRIGLMRKTGGDLHFFINGSDQGVAATRVPPDMWGVVDLYGMVVKVTLVDSDQGRHLRHRGREEHNNQARKTYRAQVAAAATATAVTSRVSQPFILLRERQVLLNYDKIDLKNIFLCTTSSVQP